MAPPRRKKRKTPGPAFQRGREFKVILPEDISEWVEAEAKNEGRPQSRVIINHLSRIPGLDKRSRLEELIADMEVILARYGSRIMLADLGEALLRAVDDVLDAKTDGELRARLDRLRVLRAEMLKSERVEKR